MTTGIDVPEILLIAEAQARDLGLADRFRASPVDFTREDWGHDFDLVLIANIFEMQNDDTAQDLVLRARQALRPDGILVIVDQIIDGKPDSVQDRFATLFAVSMLATGGGQSFRTEDYERWFTKAGLTKIALLDAPMHRIVMARPA
jgi:SAM-dependent methyltransferase